MAATPQNPPLGGLARALVQAGKLQESEAEQLLAQAHSNKTSLIEQIITSQKAGALDIARFVADTGPKYKAVPLSGYIGVVTFLLPVG